MKKGGKKEGKRGGGEGGRRRRSLVAEGGREWRGSSQAAFSAGGFPEAEVFVTLETD